MDLKIHNNKYIKRVQKNSNRKNNNKKQNSRTNNKELG